MTRASHPTQSYCSTADVLSWIQAYQERIDCSVRRIPFHSSNQWQFDNRKRTLRHASGKFFSICGYQCKSEKQPTLHQPLIKQPEIGTQGFIVQRSGEDYHLLVQARTEPGNIGFVQVGPTIQATYSNYTTVHGGKVPQFLDHFHNPTSYGARVILDTVQPELGSRFLKKWNRNVVIECQDLAEFSDPMFKWVSLRTVAKLMSQDHVVNNDARLVVGLLVLARGAQLFDEVHSPLGKAVGASFRSCASKSFENVSEVCHWFDRVRERDALEVRELPLAELPEWCVVDDEIYHDQGLYFSVIQVRVHASDREVADWDQPLISTRHKSDIVLVCKEENGVLNLLFRAAAQIGNADGAQLQPTVCLDNEPSEATPQSIVDLLKTTKSEPRLLIEASAEGGRFYRCVNRYDIRWLPPSVDPELPREYCWLTLEQVRELVDRTELISDESRSVLSLLLTAAYGS